MDLKSLPQEILPNIFKFLPVEDRKNVRLSCRVWNFACTRPEIIAHEKFVFRLGYSGDDMIQLGIAITNCQVLRTDFEFHMLALKDLPTSFWEHCGDQIKSVFIHECLVTKKTITNIFLCCPNLSTFHLQVHSDNGRELTLALNKELTLNDLVASHVERKNLMCFKFFANIRIDLENLFQVFPNIRTLGMGFLHGRGFLRTTYCTNESFYSSSYSVIKPSWSCLPPTCENLVYINRLRASTVFAPFPSSNFVGLKEIRTYVVIDFPIENIREFFRHQNQLRKLQIRINKTCSTDLKTLLFLLLKNLPELVDLEFLSSNPIRITKTEFSDFLREIKRLESLKLMFSSFVQHESRWLELPQFPSEDFLTLKKLCLSCISMNSDFDQVTQGLLNRCRSLKFLHLSFVTDDTLQKILQNQIELKTLEFSLTLDDGVKSQCSQSSFSFNRLRNLEYLIIHGARAPNVLNEFDFPKLKYFKSSSWPTEVIYTFIDNLSRKVPSLEILDVDIKFLYSPEAIEYFKRWKYLKFIKFNRFHLEGYSLSQMFLDCPSLTYIVDSRRAFYYDRFSNNLEWYNNGTQFYPPLYHKNNVYDFHL